MAHLSLCLLGPFQASLDGQPLTGFDSDRVRALLAYLAVESDRAHRRESLIGMFWPERPERMARHSLSQALSNLRRLFDGDGTVPPYLQTNRQTLQFDAGSDLRLDVAELTDLIATSRRHAHVRLADCDACVARLERAVALYRGDFLEGYSLADAPAFEEWVTLQREHLHRLTIETLEDLAAAYEQRGAFEQGVQVARQAVAMDPLRESAHRALMRLLALAGERSAAIAQYDACCRILADELGVEAEDETSALVARIREGPLVAAVRGEEGLERARRTVGACPYRGLSAFREADAPFFNGREAFTTRLVEAVHAQPLVAVIVGPSGSGKSSAVYAGLLPRLRAEGNWLIAEMRPGGQSFDALAAVLLPLLESDLSETDRLIESRKLAGALREAGVPLVDVVARALSKIGDTSRMLLLVDQFEELYTLCPEVETRRRFLDTLLAAVEAAGKLRPSPFALLVTMRADFMGQALSYRPFADVLQGASLMMGPMTRDELRSAIVKPAEKQGAALEPGLVERLLDDVGEEPGNLPLLEFALTLLWERMDAGWMTHAAYDEIGRVQGALARYAEEVYQDLAEDEREGARWILEQLVQPGEGTEDTRRVATRAEIGEERWPLVRHLADRRLVVTGRDATTGTETVEVVHEALIQRWGRLQGWMEEDRAFRTWQERLRVALRGWEGSGRDEGALLRGTTLAQAEGWLDEWGRELSPAEAAFVRAGVALRERLQVEQTRRRRRVLIGLAGGLVIALVLALLAGLQWRRADSEEQVALREASIGLAAQAVAELEGASPERAVLLALEALQHYPYTGQAESALAQAVETFKPYLILRNTEMRLRHAVWSPDAGRIAISGSEGTIKVYDAELGTELLKFNERDWSDIVGLAWSPGGKLVTVSQGLQAARVWDAETGTLLLTYEGHAGAVYHVSLSADGALALTAGEDGTARVWEVASGAERLVLAGHGAALHDAAWSPDGGRILTAGADGTVRMWGVSTALAAGRRGRGGAAFCSGPRQRRAGGDLGPRRVAFRHRRRGWRGPGVGRGHGPGAVHPHRPRRPGARCELVAGGAADRHRQRRWHGAGVGRTGRRRALHPVRAERGLVDGRVVARWRTAGHRGRAAALGLGSAGARAAPGGAHGPGWPDRRQWSPDGTLIVTAGKGGSAAGMGRAHRRADPDIHRAPDGRQPHADGVVCGVVPLRRPDREHGVGQRGPGMGPAHRRGTTGLYRTHGHRHVVGGLVARRHAHRLLGHR